MTGDRVVVLATGGTIASVRGPDGYQPGITAEQLGLEAIDDLEVEFRDVAAVNSFDLTPALLLDIASEARRTAATAGVAGVVVTHGTDTMEETAFLTSLIHDGPTPIVFTGAQIPGGEAHSDGPANLTAAITLAASPGRRAGGVSISFAGEDLPALGAQKRSTVDTVAFATRRRPMPRIAAPFPDLDGLETAVRLVTSAVADDGRGVDDAVAAGARGVVLQAFGTGNTGIPTVEAARRAIARDVLVVVTSRCPHGPVRPLYGGGGGGADLVAAGALLAGDLSGPQARILAMAALAGRSTDEASHLIDRFVAEVTPDTGATG